MSLRAVVLVKQVPDLRSAPVGVRPDGTIDRQSAPSITNPADLHAVEAALRVADEVWALSMGPEQAEQALREAMALGATRGILLADRLLAGSDTWATANALAAAIEMLGDVDVVLAGISALDGETGQVGPEVAVRLGRPQATGVEAIERDDRGLVVRRVVEGGYERLHLPLPAVVTIAETGFEPRYPTFVDRKRAERAAIERMTAADAGVDASVVGLVASPTKVAHMEPAPLPDRACRFVGTDLTMDELVAELSDRSTAAEPAASPLSAAPATEQSNASLDASELRDASSSPAIWVVCELQSGHIATASLELLGKARELAPDLGGGVGAIVAGHGKFAEAEVAARSGADVVFYADDPQLDEYRAEPFARVIFDLASEHRPEAVLFSATTTGRDVAPRVAAMLGTGLAADCTDLLVSSWKRRGVTYDALLHQVRPAMSGGVLATCVCPEARPQMATVRPGTFAPAEHAGTGRVERVEVSLNADDLRVEVLDRTVSTAEVGLAEAEVIVAGGAGCDADSWHLVEDLADAIGGKVAASRGAVEAGLAPRSAQVGQTGTTVRPRLYIACGISGALQHAVGMRGARTVVAINRDQDAMIFGFAHVGIVDDVRSALPQLVAALRARPSA